MSFPCCVACCRRFFPQKCGFRKHMYSFCRAVWHAAGFLPPRKKTDSKRCFHIRRIPVRRKIDWTPMCTPESCLWTLKNPVQIAADVLSTNELDIVIQFDKICSRFFWRIAPDRMATLGAKKSHNNKTHGSGNKRFTQTKRPESKTVDTLLQRFAMTVVTVIHQ